MTKEPDRDRDVRSMSKTELRYSQVNWIGLVLLATGAGLMIGAATPSLGEVGATSRDHMNGGPHISLGIRAGKAYSYTSRRNAEGVGASRQT